MHRVALVPKISTHFLLHLSNSSGTSSRLRISCFVFLQLVASGNSLILSQCYDTNTVDWRRMSANITIVRSILKSTRCTVRIPTAKCTLGSAHVSTHTWPPSFHSAFFFSHDLGPLGVHTALTLFGVINLQSTRSRLARTGCALPLVQKRENRWCGHPRKCELLATLARGNTPKARTVIHTKRCNPHSDRGDSQTSTRVERLGKSILRCVNLEKKKKCNDCANKRCVRMSRVCASHYLLDLFSNENFLLDLNAFYRTTLGYVLNPLLYRFRRVPIPPTRDRSEYKDRIINHSIFLHFRIFINIFNYAITPARHNINVSVTTFSNVLCRQYIRAFSVLYWLAIYLLDRTFSRSAT